MSAGGRGPFDQDHEFELDAYIDGQLSGPARAAFEARLAGDPSLAAELDTQRRIDRAMGGLFAVPTFPGVPTNGHPAPATPHHNGSGSATAAAAAVATVAASTGARVVTRWFRREVVLGGLIATVGITALVLTWFAEFAPAWSPLSFGAVYNQSVATGGGGCGGAADGADMESVCQLSVGRPLRLTSVPPGVEVLGVSEARVLSARTVVLRAKVNGAEVLVFADRAAHDNPATDAPPKGLRIFRRQLGDIVLYELTPLDKPHLLDHCAFADGT